ncbi:hypothetical protein BP6252_10689 [Coleophoma cylindrospora]|uniref:Uncharacterized protein n=1 Tax=Coleophoma cylindrospora TaxID=1849047 RepID=A0A3D8QTN0_9HELO|nr:hypothetical protein BP6252_10689 [Coleophoma cylindrospora]
MSATVMTTSIISDRATISTFNRGPLQTSFAPAASCLSTLTWSSTLYFGHWGPGVADTSCYPKSSGEKRTSDWDMYYYSPGICPDGWSHAATFSSSYPGISHSALSIASETTAVLCCPLGYQYLVDGFGHQCWSSLTSGSTYIYTPLDSNSLPGGPIQTRSADGLIQITINSTASSAFGDGVPIWWQSTDPTVFPLVGTTPTTWVVTPTLSNSTPSLRPSKSNSPTNGTSTSVKIGVGVAVPLILIALVLGIVLYIRHHKRLTFPNRQNLAEPYQQNEPAKELSGTQLVELYTNPVELYTDDPSQNTTRIPSELPTD